MGSDPLDETPWRGLEPASLLVNLLPDLWRTARQAWPLLLAAFVGGGLDTIVNLSLLTVFLGIAIGRTVLHFLTLRYRMHAGKLEIQTGLLARRSRSIDPARIQNVEIIQNLFHKMAGLVELRIETAGDTGVEGMLSALSVEEANALRGDLHPDVMAPTGEYAPEPASDEILAITPLELVAYGMSAGRVGAAVLAGGVAMELLGQINPGNVQQAADGLRPGAVLGLGLLAVALGYALSVGNTLLRFYGFRLVRSARGLRFEAGLFTRRGVEIPVGKVQLVRVEEPWLRRLMGYGTLRVETAASQVPDEASGGEGHLPMVATEEQAALTRVVLPSLDVDPWVTPLAPAAARAIATTTLAGLVRGGALGVLLATWAGPAVVVLPAAGALFAFLDARRQGWYVSEGFVVARAGFLSRNTWIVPRTKIQSTHRTDGPIMRRLGLGRVTVWVAGSSVSLPVVLAADADKLFARLAVRSGAAGAESLSGGGV